MLPQSLPEALDALEADKEFGEVVGNCRVVPDLQAQRGRAVHRFVTDWEFREHAYHL